MTKNNSVKESRKSNKSVFSSYQEKIKQEARFWDKVADEQIDNGMIPDIRKAVKRKKVIAFYDDPKIEKILRGKFRDFIIKKASEKKGRALELGCGVGWLSLELARNGMNVDAIDISKRRIEIAKDYLKIVPKTKSFGNINYLIADLNKINLKECFYDSVVVWDTFHHIPEIERLIREVKKGLKPGGNFLVLDSISYPTLNRILADAFYFILPAEKNYFQKLRSACRRFCNVKKIETKADESPFEGATKRGMIKVIGKYFAIRRKKEFLAFTRYISPRIRIKEPLKYELIYLMKNLEDMLIKMRLLKGEQVFIWAQKE